jgi:lipopolysaccharide assembly outer membrane protein LptD (OstA)
MILKAGNKTVSRLKLLFAAASFGFFSFISSGANFFDLDSFTNSKDRNLSNTKADSWSYVGKNIVVKGNVYIPYGDITVYADRAIINTETKDIEASGNIRLYKVKVGKKSITISDLIKLRAMPEVMVKIEGYSTDPLGNQTIESEIHTRGDMIKCSRLSGNLSSGVMEINDFEARYKTFICKAKSGTRKPSGEVVVNNAEISSCEYLENDEGHYSISCAEAKIYPYASDNFGFSGYNPDIGDHSIWGYNCWLKIFGAKILPVPIFYKPKDESPGLLQMRGGYDSDWGIFLGVSKRFLLSDYPYASTKMILDWYSLRGVGYGNETEIQTEYSKTDIFAYSLYDMRPYNSSDVENGRLTIPHARYDFKLSNVTHITPRLDFRGNFELTSDYYFRSDFLGDAFDANPEPATYAALEQQFDRLSTAFYIRPQVNNFYTTVERLPEWRIDVPRQELFSNIYYQGETSLSNLKMKWGEFDKPRTTGNLVDPSNYSALRFDTLHMFYYPFKLDWLNLIPRSGVRMTYYEKSSKAGISEQDLENMFAVENPESTSSDAFIKNYDSKGGNQFRFTGEFGLEANTKVYQAWQNTKNAFWKLDGMRHVFEPYVNYTYIPDPTVDRKNLYYFDDIDRIQQQNFARLGMLNRLQTRRGPYGGEQIYNWMSMENYWDYHFQKQDGFNNVGDFCTKFDFNPFEDLKLTSLLSIDAGQNNPHDGPTIRNGKPVSRKGINGDFINKWELMANYQIIEDVKVNFGYVYQDYYKTESAYSMGSTLSEIESGSAFDQNYNTRIQTLVFGLSHPVTMDRKLKASYQVFYDFEQGYIREIRGKLSKTMHCWEVAIEVARSTNRDDSGNKEYKNSIMATMTLTGMDSPLKQVDRQGMPGQDNNSTSGTNIGGGVL